MQKYFLISLLMCAMSFYGFGQVDSLRAEQLRKEFWENRLECWQSVDVPEKWQDESAVILCKHTNYWVKKRPIVAVMEEKYHTHKRIKILDNNAVDAFSEFSFAESQSYYNLFWGSSNLSYYYGIKVIKPDGREEIVGESEKVQKQVAYRRQKVGYQKIAIPNLEKGDIIDFYYCMERKFPMESFYMYDPIRYFMNDDYPIVRQELSVQMARKCYLNCKSINGAPLLEESSDDDKVVTYHMIDEDRDKYQNELWSYPIADLPCIKLQAFYPGSNWTISPTYSKFLGEPIKMKSEIKPEGLIGLAKLSRNAGAGTFFPSLKKYIFSKHGKNKDIVVDDVVDDVYYFLREYWCQQQFFMKNMRIGYYEWFTMYSTVGAISRILKIYNVKHEILYVVPRNFGGVENLLFIDELRMGLHLEGEKGSRFVCFMHPNCTSTNIPSYMEGVKAFGIPMLEETPKLKLIEIPKKETENLVSIESKLSLDSTKTKVCMQSDFIISGQAKQEWDSVVINNRVYLNEFKAAEYGKFIKDKSKTKDLTAIRNFKEKFDVRLIEEDKDRLIKLESNLKSYFGLDDCKVLDFKLHSSGRWSDKSKIHFTIIWESKNQITNIGDRYLLALGRFIKKPIGVEYLKDERVLDIHLNKSVKVLHNVTLNLPDGMELKGLDSMILNYDDDNFTLDCRVDINSDNPRVKFMQFVKNNHLSKAEIDKLREFFNQNRILNEKQVVIQAADY